RDAAGAALVSDERAAGLAKLVAERGLDGLLVGDLVRPGDSGPDAIANVRWLTGFSGTSALALVGLDERLFFTDFRYVERAAREDSKAEPRPRSPSPRRFGCASSGPPGRRSRRSSPRPRTARFRTTRRPIG